MNNFNRLRLPLLLTLSLVGTALFAVCAGTPALAACTPGAVGKPDLGFVDSNCDGIDGDRAAAIFVAPARQRRQRRQLRSPDGDRIAAAAVA